MPRLIKIAVLGLLVLPFCQAPGTAHGAVTKSQMAIKQMNAEAETLIDAQVRQRPDADAPQVALLMGGIRILVTGHVTGTEWYRITADNVSIGYLSRDVIRPLSEQSAALFAPLEPKVGTGAEPAVGQFDLKDRVIQDCPHCPVVVILPPGSFTMGSNDAGITERPAHRVSIPYSFGIGRYEVTVSQWMTCVSDDACSYKPKAVEAPERMAVRNVSWEDAQQYLRWLSKKTGKVFRLPTEAEWEYAARAGSQAQYAWGDGAAKGRAACKGCDGSWSKKAPPAIGSYEANAYGLYDFHGGAAEWTADCWHRTYKDAPADGSARQESACPERVLRGGSWRDGPDFIRSTSRASYEVILPRTTNGFRVAMTVQ